MGKEGKSLVVEVLITRRETRFMKPAHPGVGGEEEEGGGKETWLEGRLGHWEGGRKGVLVT